MDIYQWQGRIIAWFSQVWVLLTAPHRRLKGQEERVNSQLLSGLLLILPPVACLFLVSLAGPFAQFGSYVSDLAVFGGLLLALGGIYWLNRAGFFQLAVVILLCLGSAAIFAEAILDSDYIDLAFLLLLLAGGSLFFPSRVILLMGGTYLAGSALLLFILPLSEVSVIGRFIFPLLTISTILSLSLSHHRNRLEALRNKKLIASELRYSLSVEAVNDGIWDWDLKTNAIYFSPRWKALLGYRENELENHPDEWFTRIHAQDRAQFQTTLGMHLQGISPQLECEYRIQHADRTYRWMLCRGLAIRDQNGNACRIVGSQTDVTDRKLAQERLAHDALHDALTGLPNRALFMDRLGQRLEHTRRHPDDRFAILFLDLDRFKVINDSLGHLEGDRFLVATARIIRACLRPEDTFARLGGDEFAILLEEVHEVEDALRVANRIHARMGSTTMLGMVNRSSTASIGITLFNGNYHDPQAMLRDADTAMYRAKALGGGRSQLFDTTMYDRALATLQLEADLKQAVVNQEWLIHYQPIFSVMDGKLAGVEALLRWMHPQRGLVSPAEFIADAEETGLILPIGEFILRAACTQVRAWRRHHPDLWVSVNLSGRQFQDQNLFGMIRQTLRETGLPGNALQLEITESVAMQDLAHSIRVLEDFNALGVFASLDDFGKGYSSLNYLKQLPIKTMKIDRSFIQDLELDRRNEAITSAIIALGHTLGLEVIAEGVEKSAQFDFLRSLACDKAQGLLLSPPLSSAEVDGILRSGAAPRYPLQALPEMMMTKWDRAESSQSEM